MTSEVVPVEPDFRRLTEALRDTGYSLNTAIADIIDNSIAADAAKVNVTFAFDENYDVYLSIADDGCGMDKAGVINALRLGSPRRESAASLGKFGMGLKTASLAFCRRLVVVSKADGSQPVHGVFDLDQVQEAGQMVATIEDPTPEQLARLRRTAREGAGTLIEWRTVDRVLHRYGLKAGKAREKALGRMIEALTQHLSLVFQRFLDCSDDRVTSHIEMTVNDNPVLPYDPFCTDLVSPFEIADRINVAIEQADGSESEAELIVRLYRIPNTNEWPNDERRREARVATSTQGVYVYRENRLIHGPDWLGQFTMEPHTNLARVELSFDHLLDEAFKVDIKKSRIDLPPELLEALKKQFNLVRKEAERVRRGLVDTKRAQDGGGLHAGADRVIETRASSLDTATIESVTDNTANVKNRTGQGSHSIRIVVGATEHLMRIEPVPDLPSAVLWMPSVIDQRPAVSLNCGHDFYRKVYLPNKDRQNLIQSLDFMLWSLAQAELNNLNDSNGELFEDFRIETSRNLRRLTQDLPEPDLDDIDDNSSDEEA